MSKKNPQLICKRIKKLNTIWHPESTVIFKSEEEKEVIEHT